MKLSIVIALYNTEAYIERCIRSIYNQNELSIDEYEVFVINDGSTDEGQKIVEKLQAEFSNIRLVNKENGGQSTARNIGFDLATGNYFFCLDSDDFVDANALTKALNYCEQRNLDMLPIFYRRFSESYEQLPERTDNYPIIDEVITGGDFMNRFVVSGSMWRYFYKTSVLRDNNLQLTEGIYHEDEEFIVKFLSYSKKISYQRHLVYNHIVRANSTVNKKDKKHRIRLLNDLSSVINSLDKHRDDFKKDSSEYIGISKKVEQLTVSIFLRMKADKLNFEEAEYFVANLYQVGLFPIQIKNLSINFKLAAKLLNNRLLRRLYYR
ncbi:glycosyltransferase family 2 protein [Pedobacter panaciterrae]|uniref:glycosyltransferase family 2 protein n=1 Tax=Pedobacter panaciterrae TaxID=363849 RepID=UPI0025956E19|nr:glycosyltransferase [uncultured Pedobacter sp.]